MTTRLRLAICAIWTVAAAFAVAPAEAQTTPAESLDPMPAADATAIADEPIETRGTLIEMVQYHEEKGLPEGQSLIGMKTQILLDRAHSSPGVIDGFGGENTAKAIRAFERVHGLTPDGVLDEEVWAALRPGERPVARIYTITEDDLAQPFEPLPEDYAELAKRERLGFTSAAEMFAERFHMDIELLKALNPGARFDAVGERILVADVEGDPPTGEVTRMVAERENAQLFAYREDGTLVTAYPATIGSRSTPSPSGTVEVLAVATDPVYYYRPATNFQQGDNDKPLDLPPGPNNPVGTVWIDLSKETYGIHGSPEPAAIDKTFSHGCVRLTNWDAEELARLVKPGATVEFVQ